LRKRGLAALLALPLLAACAHPHPSKATVPAQDPNQISIVVFSQRRTPVPFTLIVGDSVILDTIAQLPHYFPAIVMTAAVTLHSGGYRVVVIDRARAKSYEAKVRIPGDRARIELWFDVGASNAEVVYGERVYQ